METITEHLKLKAGIRFKLIATMLTLIVAFVTVLTFAQITLYREVLEKELDKRIALMKDKLISRGGTLSDNLAEQVQNNIATLNYSGAAELLRKVVEEDKELHYAILMDSTRTALIHTLQPNLEQEKLSAEPDIFASNQSKKTIQEFALGKIAVMEFDVPIQVSAEPWGVLRIGFSLDMLNQEIASSRGEIRQQTNELVTRALIFTALILLIGIIVVAYISNHLTRPLRTLTQLAYELGNGNFAVGENIQADIKDEVGVLTHAFVDMSKRLKTSYDNLEEYNRTLEQKVAERTEQLAEARDQAIAANNSKSAFLSMVSHEIRTPMNAILGLAHLLLQTTLTAKQEDYLKKQQISAKSLLNIINDILDFSKIEANKLEIEQVNFNLNEVLNNLTTYTSISAANKGLAINVSVANNVPLLLQGDPLRLGQILLNLVNNAIKFTDQGEILIKIALLETTPGIQQSADNSIMLEFTVQDSGIGLSEEQIGRLFQAFSQADGSTTRKYGGTGLGLAICKRLVNLMQGDIGVTSELGHGSRFAFTARFGIQPQAAFSPEPTAQQNEKLVAIRGTHILVVEDQPINQLIATELLQSKGFIVTIANNGQDAVELVEQHHYDAVLMDLQMPVMDGYEATGIIRANPRHANLPILAMSAHVMAAEKEKCQGCGMNGHVEKPIELDNLFETLLIHIKPQ